MRMAQTAVILLAASILPSAAAAAGEPAAVSPAATDNSPFRSEYRLSAQEIERLLEAAAKKPESAGQELPDTAPRVHGEVGFAIGTGGSHSAYGTGVYPLGNDGAAIISFDVSRFGDDPRR